MAQTPDPDRTKHWLVRPRTIRLLWLIFGTVLALTVLAGLFVDFKPHFGIEDSGLKTIFVDRERLEHLSPYLEELDLRVEVLGAARLSPGSEGVASSVGFDVGGGVSADLGMGLHLAVSAAVRQAGGDVGGEDYSERFIDDLGELGWVF